MRTSIRMLYEGRSNDGDRCSKACAKAKYENGVWTCPVFKFGVEKVNVVTEGGLLCRLFERRDA